MSGRSSSSLQVAAPRTQSSGSVEDTPAAFSSARKRDSRIRRAGSSWQRCRTRTTSSSRRTADSRANQSWRARVDPTVRCAGNPDRSALRSAWRQSRFIRSSSKQQGRTGSTRRGADSNQLRFSLSIALRSARSSRHARKTSRARPSTCAGVQVERRRRWNRNRSLPSSFAMDHGSAYRSTDPQSTGSLATPLSAPPEGGSTPGFLPPYFRDATVP